MISETLTVLRTVTVVNSASILLLLLLRKPLRRFFGPRLSYAAWGLLPTSLLASLLPGGPVAPGIQVLMQRLPAMPEMVPAAPASVAELASGQLWVIAVWLLGAALMGGYYCLQQQRFTRGLGRLTAEAGYFRAATTQFGPALLGLWQPRIVVPADFAVRYSVEEQALILAHEQVHRERGDTWCNALLALAQCLLWFNPLLHYVARLIRFDQELACDATVLAERTGARQTYAAAMLRTQRGGMVGPLGCQWPQQHPLKTRILQLQRRAPSPARHLGGKVLTLGLICLGSYAAWAAQSEPGTADKRYYMIGVSAKLNGANYAPKVMVQAGQVATIRFDGKEVGEAPVEFDFKVMPLHDDEATLDLGIKLGEEEISHTQHKLHNGEAASIRVKRGAEAGKPAMDLDLQLVQRQTVAR